MFDLSNPTRRDEAGFVMKPCVFCLTRRLHAIDVSRSEFAGIKYGTKAFVVCTECGLEREIGGDAAQALLASAASRLEMLGALHHADPEGAGEGHPAGTEWIVADGGREAAA
jgi:hypothetical protein